MASRPCFGVLIWLVVGPYTVAKRRGHPNAQAIQVCSLVGLLFWPALAVAWVWAYTGKPKQSKAHPAMTERAREVIGDGPGLFLVCGVDRETGMDTSLRIRAESPANAQVKAELRGMIVTKIDLP